MKTIMPMGCARTVITLRAAPKWLSLVTTQTGFYMLRVCARTVIWVSTTRRKDLQRRLTQQLNPLLLFLKLSLTSMSTTPNELYIKKPKNLTSLKYRKNEWLLIMRVTTSQLYNCKFNVNISPNDHLLKPPTLTKSTVSLVVAQFHCSALQSWALKWSTVFLYIIVNKQIIS